MGLESRIRQNLGGLGALTLGSIVGGSVLLSGLSGCSSTQSSAKASDGSEPTALQPEGGGNIDGMVKLPPEMLPDPIDLTEKGAITRTLVHPEIIDTNALAKRRQLTGPFEGDIRMIKHILPKHGRDKTLGVNRETPPLPIGETVAMDRVVMGDSTGFEAISQTEWSPPDPTLAVGPDHVVVTVNAAIAFYDKDGNETFSSHLGTPGSPGFFESVGASSNFVFDPKCFYDHKSERFVVIALEHLADESWIDIAISDDSDPNGVWYKYRTWSVVELSTPDPTLYWVDYPGFGFDDNAFYVTGNLFHLSGPGAGFGGQLFRMYEKAPMLNGDPIEFMDIAPNTGASLQVAQMFGPSPQCIFVSRASSTSLWLWTMDDPLGSPSIRRVEVGGMAFTSGPSNNAPNPGGGEISTLDGRLMNVHYRDGNLYTAHGVDGDSGRTVGRWYHIDTDGWPSVSGTPSLVQQGDIAGTSGRHHYFPAIYSDQDHNVGVITSRSSPSEFASVQISGRLVDDPLGTMSDPIEVAIGDNGADGRWGDYLDIAIDPNDDKTFWIIGMYQRDFGWQTWIDSFVLGEAGCRADLNGDGNLNFFDISAFLSLYAAEDPSVDFLEDGLFNFSDISMFLQMFADGC